ncbi:MAG: 30S ribosomal protein S20 [Clostridiaceae bacterium]|nr:30S ribosomal protein S20 [Clostridiaceae bacterium]
MPNIKSAKKRVNVIKTKTLRNRMINSKLKTCLKKFQLLAEQGDKEQSKAAYDVAIKKLDQAVAKGVIHKNTSSRKKSKLTLKLNKIA